MQEPTDFIEIIIYGREKAGTGRMLCHEKLQTVPLMTDQFARNGSSVSSGTDDALPVSQLAVAIEHHDAGLEAVDALTEQIDPTAQNFFFVGDAAFEPRKP